MLGVVRGVKVVVFDPGDSAVGVLSEAEYQYEEVCQKSKKRT